MEHFFLTIFEISLAVLIVYTSVTLFILFLNTFVDIKKKIKNVPVDVGLTILVKGIIYGTTVYTVCQVIADRIFTIWSPGITNNADIMQKFKIMLNSSTRTTQ